jgi:hypothetical protein
MKKLLFLLLILSGCAKEQVEDRLVQLTVEGSGTFTVTYGTSNLVTEKSQQNWTSIMSANAGDTIHLTVNTAATPATIYLRIQIDPALLYCKSLFIEPESSGTLNYIVER